MMEPRQTPEQQELIRRSHEIFEWLTPDEVKLIDGGPRDSVLAKAMTELSDRRRTAERP